MPTIKDVAERAGVAVGTVSHVINGSVRVSSSLRTRVMTAIRQLDYHPNHVARSLKTSKTRTLGIIVPDLTISFFPQVMRGAEAAARAQGYALVAVNSDDDSARQKELLTMLRSQRVEGILLVMAAGPTPTMQIQRMVEAGIPVVCLDRIPDKLRIDSVAVEDVTAAEMGVKHLLSAGHRRIAIVTGPPALKNERGRLQGYKRALEQAGVPYRDELVWTGNLRPLDVAALCRPLLADTKLRPDALISTNGPTGLGVLRALRDSGLATPRDVGFVSFDELTVEDLFSPAVTTIVQPAYEIGFCAAEILLQRIHQTHASPQLHRVRLPAKLTVRESSLIPVGRLLVT